MKAAFRRIGCKVDAADDPCYFDLPLDKQPARLDVQHMPELQNAVNSLMSGGQFVVISLGHFGVPRVWIWVAQHLARKGASIRDMESGKVWDFAADPGAGYEVGRLVEAMANRLRTENARAARVESGKLGPKERMSDLALRRKCLRLWGDKKLSAADVERETGVSAATLYRHLGPKTEAEAKQLAKAAKENKMAYHEETRTTDCPKCGTVNHIVIAYAGDSRANSEYEEAECCSCGTVVSREKCWAIFSGLTADEALTDLRTLQNRK